MSHQHSNASPHLAHHFVDAQQQKESATLGMWLFLATEVLFFGGLFLLYAVYRHVYHDGFVYGSHELNIQLGCFNTAVLITSSLTMAMGVYYAQTGRNRACANALLLTMILACVFLVVKYFEYKAKYEHTIFPGMSFDIDTSHAAEVLKKPGFILDPDHVRQFFFIYYCMTGLHGIHVVLGIVAIGWLWLKARANTFSAEYFTPVELIGLYWHFVDVVWIFLFPLLYLLGRH